MKTVTATVLFGMVSIPVKVTGVVKATSTSNGFKNLHAVCNTPTSSKTWCVTCDREVTPDEVVKGVKAGGKNYIPVPAESLEAVKAERTDVITITKFVTASILDFYEQFYKHYHLIPDEKLTDAYVLLTMTLDKKQMVGIGSTCLWGKEHPVAIHPVGGGLMCSLLHVTEDIVPRPYDPPMLSGTKVQQKSMLALAADLVDGQAGVLEPGDITSESRAKREQLVEQVLTEAAVPAMPTNDLMSMLKLSIGRGKKVKA